MYQVTLILYKLDFTYLVGANMTVERAVMAFAGMMVLLSVALTFWLHPNFYWLTLFVGANLLQSAFTGFCPAAIFINKVLGLKTEAQKASCKLN